LIVDRAADVSTPTLAATAGVASLVGMFFSELAFIRAGQSVPLS